MLNYKIIDLSEETDLIESNNNKICIEQTDLIESNNNKICIVCQYWYFNHGQVKFCLQWL